MVAERDGEIPKRYLGTHDHSTGADHSMHEMGMDHDMDHDADADASHEETDQQEHADHD